MNPVWRSVNYAQRLIIGALAACGYPAFGCVLAYSVYVSVRRAWTFTCSCVRSLARRNKARILQCVARQHAQDFDRLITSFENTDPSSSPTGRVHSHRTAAGARAGATAWFTRLIERCGFNRYDYQSSSREACPGSREPFWLKDTKYPYRGDSLPSTPVITMVDVDCYLDMRHLSAAAPHLLWTFQPYIPSGTCYDGATTWSDLGRAPGGPPGDVWRVTVNGGQCGPDAYVSRIHDWGVDTISVRTGSFWSWSDPLKVTVFNVRQKRFGHWAAILLVPRTSYPWWIEWLLVALIDLKPVRRLDFSQGQPVAVSRFWNAVERTNQVAMAPVGSFITSTIVPATSYDVAVNGLIAQGTSGTSVAARLENPDRHYSTDCMKRLVPGQEPTDVSQGVINYTVTRAHGEDPVVRTWPVVLHAGVGLAVFAPASSVGNAIQCINSRVTAPQNRAIEYAPDQDLRRYLKDFLQFFERGQCVPWEFEEISDSQPKPSAQLALRQADSVREEIDDRNKCFQKKEFYNETKDPRNITGPVPYERLKLACFARGLEEKLKKHAWYAFGKTPREIAQIVVDICIAAIASVEDGDYSRLDGHCSLFYAIFEQEVYQWMYREEFFREIETLLMDHKDRGAVLRPTDQTPAIKFDPGLSKRSGEATTSSMNTLWTKFLNYLYWRFEGLTSEAAWNKPMIAGGDDSHAADVDGERMARVATRCGQVYKSQCHKRGDLGVNFLSRFYSPAVWDGDSSSMCDLPRQLQKMHLTVHLPNPLAVQKERRAREKALSYYLTDEHTPIIGRLAKSILARPSPDRPPTTQQLLGVSWWAQYAKEDQWPNTPGNWMQDYVTRSGLDKDKVAAFEANLDWWCIALEQSDWDSLLSATVLSPLFRGEVIIGPGFRRVDDDSTVPVGTPPLALLPLSPAVPEARETLYPTARAKRANGRKPAATVSSGKPPAKGRPRDVPTRTPEQARADKLSRRAERRTQGVKSPAPKPAAVAGPPAGTVSATQPKPQGG